MHIGSGSGRLFTVGIQVKPLVPFLTSTNLPSSPGIMIAASLEISGGAALSASLIIASLDIPLTPLPFILCPSSANERVERLRAKPTNQIVLRTRFMVPSLDNWIRCECEPRRVRSIDTAPFASELVNTVPRGSPGGNGIGHLSHPAQDHPAPLEDVPRLYF